MPDKEPKPWTAYDKDMVFEYQMVRERPDGRFLYEPFLEHLQQKGLQGSKLADIGAGRGTWSIWAAQHGAEVFASDVNENMLAACKEAVTNAHAENVHLAQADAAALPYPDASFDEALSIQVACTLPEESFDKHFSEMARILKKGGEGIVTAPTSFGEVFTSGKHEHQMLIERLNVLVREPNPMQRLQMLATEHEVHLATFVEDGDYLKLITDEHELQPGQKIWRKLHGIVVPNYYHPHEEYTAAFAKAGLASKQTVQRTLTSEQERTTYNKTVSANRQLGPEYVGHNPHNVYIIEKP